MSMKQKKEQKKDPTIRPEKAASIVKALAEPTQDCIRGNGVFVMSIIHDPESADFMVLGNIGPDERIPFLLDVVDLLTTKNELGQLVGRKPTKIDGKPTRGH